ncbi:putative lipoprotein aminopeptidase LpqL [Colletotrichum sidae]|uniref:Peptide hydrolase n=1 Tax=Colletotrichum sidae TaxID=1347389 RepID=A0A4R8TNR2_9PEZI|nr:putative lipoprotein aminopeptidase LpqL [Colletotrichum sidae]
MRLSSTASILSWTGLAICAVHERQADQPLVDSASLQAQITKDNLEANLVKLADVATANGGNRAFGYPGYAASVEYVLGRISSIPGTRTWTQDFPATFASELRANLTVNKAPFPVYGLSQSPATPPEGVTAQLAAGPEGAAACAAASYADLDVAGKIVLVREALCPGYRDGYHAGVMKPAAAAGAVAVLVINDFALNLTAGTLGPADDGTYVPTGFVNKYIGDPLRARLVAGEELTTTFWEDLYVDSRVTQNVFAETEGGDAENVIVLGAHLDSVAWGPGINDNGSGVSLLVELFLALSKFRVNNKIRFAWWGAEERGLLGSRHYVNNLDAAGADTILAYLNFDMVSRGYYGVFDGNGASYGVPAPPGSDVIQELFTADFAAKGVSVTAARFTNGSDYASFWQVLGKPIGGLHTGTGSAQDPCYHRECDDITNPDVDQLTVNAKVGIPRAVEFFLFGTLTFKTTAHVLSVLAVNGTDLVKGMAADGLLKRSRDKVREIATTEELDDEHHHC